jgi:tripartite-type tricarboxylate transporter receptor subunit TctC
MDSNTFNCYGAVYARETPFTYEDLTPIVNVSENSMVLYVLNDSPWYTLEEFLNYAKETPVNISLVMELEHFLI